MLWTACRPAGEEYCEASFVVRPQDGSSGFLLKCPDSSASHRTFVVFVQRVFVCELRGLIISADTL